MSPLRLSPLILLFICLTSAANASGPELLSNNSIPIEDGAQIQYDHEKAFAADKLNLNQYNPANFPFYSARGHESTLRQVLLVHRHGDRTPIKFRQGDSLATEPFWKFHGLGELTNRGKERMYMLGHIMRQRYKRFMKGSVSKNMRLSRSSGSSRCIESAQLFLAAFLPLNTLDSPDADALVWNSECEVGQMWQPASIQTMSKSIDGMLAEGECEELKKEYEAIDKSGAGQFIHREYTNEAKIVREVLGYEIDYFYKWFWVSGHVMIERSFFPDRLDDRIVAIYDRIIEAGRIALVAYQSTVKSRRLRSGLLINDMIEHMKKSRQQILNSQDSYKLIHYSTHDINLYSLLGVLENVGKFSYPPDFGANIIMELHQEDDVWFVKLFYMPQVPSKLVPINIKACKDSHPKKYCTLDKLEEVTQPFIIKNWQSWMAECKNDIQNADPYAL